MVSGELEGRLKSGHPRLVRSSVHVAYKGMSFIGYVHTP